MWASLFAYSSQPNPLIDLFVRYLRHWYHTQFSISHCNLATMIELWCKSDRNMQYMLFFISAKGHDSFFAVVSRLLIKWFYESLNLLLYKFWFCHISKSLFRLTIVLSWVHYAKMSVVHVRPADTFTKSTTTFALNCLTSWLLWMKFNFTTVSCNMKLVLFAVVSRLLIRRISESINLLQYKYGFYTWWNPFFLYMEKSPIVLLQFLSNLNEMPIFWTNKSIKQLIRIVFFTTENKLNLFVNSSVYCYEHRSCLLITVKSKEWFPCSIC